MSPTDGDARDVQYLLNAFVFFNILEILAILGLAHLDRKQKQTAARRLSALLPQSVDENSDEEDSRAAKDPAAGEDRWQAEPSSSDVHPRRFSSLGRHAGRASVSSREQSIPLLGNGSRASTVRGSRYLVEAVVSETPDPSAAKVKVLRTKAEVRRGEVFAVLSGAMIGFAWVLFMGTAWYRLRSKEERGGGSGNFTGY